MGLLVLSGSLSSGGGDFRIDVDGVPVLIELGLGHNRFLVVLPGGESEEEEVFGQRERKGRERQTRRDSLDVLKLELCVTIRPVLELVFTVLLNLLILGNVLAEFELVRVEERKRSEVSFSNENECDAVPSPTRERLTSLALNVLIECCFSSNSVFLAIKSSSRSSFPC